MSRSFESMAFSERGMTSKASASSTLRWVSGSNLRMLSTSSPKNSMRYGSSLAIGKISTMPPRTLISPRCSTMTSRT